MKVTARKDTRGGVEIRKEREIREGTDEGGSYGEGSDRVRTGEREVMDGWIKLTTDRSNQAFR